MRLILSSLAARRLRPCSLHQPSPDLNDLIGSYVPRVSSTQAWELRLSGYAKLRVLHCTTSVSAGRLLSAFQKPGVYWTLRGYRPGIVLFAPHDLALPSQEVLDSLQYFLAVLLI